MNFEQLEMQYSRTVVRLYGNISSEIWDKGYDVLVDAFLYGHDKPLQTALGTVRKALSTPARTSALLHDPVDERQQVAFEHVENISDELWHRLWDKISVGDPIPWRDVRRVKGAICGQ